MYEFTRSLTEFSSGTSKIGFGHVLIRGVTAHKHDGLVHTSVLPSQFGMVSVQQVTVFFLFIKQWFTEQIALLSLNKFNYNSFS